jgi:hypothetical protein
MAGGAPEPAKMKDIMLRYGLIPASAFQFSYPISRHARDKPGHDEF